MSSQAAINEATDIQQPDSEPLGLSALLGRCDCATRTHCGQFPLLLLHLPDCQFFGSHVRELIEGLVRGIESWAADEAGVHPDCWQWYERAKIALGEPVKAIESR